MAFERRTVEIPPGAELPFDAAAWHDVFVLVQQGSLEVEGRCGTRARFRVGATLTLSGLPLRTLRNPGSTPAVLMAVTRTDEFCDRPESQLT